MQRYLIAAVGALLLLATAGDALAQRYGSGDGRNRWVSVTNDSSFTMVAIYAAPSRLRQSFIGGPDLIPNDTIRPGSHLTVNFDLGDGECWLDLRARGSDGRDWIERNFNVCAEGTWRLVN